MNLNGYRIIGIIITAVAILLMIIDSVTATKGHTKFSYITAGFVIATFNVIILCAYFDIKKDN